jgi:hypothetical protein
MEELRDGTDKQCDSEAIGTEALARVHACKNDNHWNIND